ncbi:tetratricopeptide repeat protein [Sphingobium nicotianae]|uniref:Tetratricopeptide repeat protein n=1 Tax=Sphingobium nicotianae TaxID=2782607 RepID=A0A9X1DC28_9SPHN|nr:tetratricopeptide repeat protein [Sphingobium nicotianae]MBT2187256.1 hypothetical protein [Sphingobium nicotianae]
MNRTYRSIGCCALMASLLAGCAGRHASVAIRPVGVPEATALSGADALIRQGRRFLASENYGLAIAQFREAMRFDENSAAASNGLGIAYASIGRDDLARRYFERAIAFAPTDASYRRNLDRFASTTDRAGDAELAADMPAGQDEGPVGYHLRQEASSPVDHDKAADLSLALPPAGDKPVLTEARLAVGTLGAMLTTRAPQAAASAAPQQPVRFTLDRAQAPVPAYGPAPVLKRVSIYEVRIAARKPAEVLAEIMQRDYLAQWDKGETVAPEAREALTGQAAFRAALGHARGRIANALSITMARQACAQARLASYTFYAAARTSSSQCAS